MHRLDRTTARALVEAGYMSLDTYVATYFEEPCSENPPASRSGTFPDYGSARLMKPTSYRFGAGPLKRALPPRP